MLCFRFHFLESYPLIRIILSAPQAQLGFLSCISTGFEILETSVEHFGSCDIGGTTRWTHSA